MVYSDCMANKTKLIRISVALDDWLDKQRLVPNETYEHLLRRLLKVLK